MSNTIGYIKIIIIIMAFYSFAITTLSYSLPDASLTYVTSFSELSDQFTLEDTSSKISESLESQTSLPIIELGALVFYSGNYFIDLLLNFATALPQMVGLLLTAIFGLINLPYEMAHSIQIFFTLIIGSLYTVLLIEFLLNLRGGRASL